MPSPRDARPLPKRDLAAMTLQELTSLAEMLGEKAYRGRQLFQWVHGKGVASVDEMTNLPARFRTLLADHTEIHRISPSTRQRSSDGTLKMLFRLTSGLSIETVLIPDLEDDGSPNRLTVCVSSQVGCAMGCVFCATGLLGFKQNLSAGEIVDQVRFMDRVAREEYGRGITNVVYMGMGEPLLNYRNVLASTEILGHPAVLGLSPRRITVSTVGLAARIVQLAEERAPFKLAISLHAPTDEKRSAIMPVNRSTRTDLRALRDAVQTYDRLVGRPVTYEYCLFEGTNDGEEDAEALADVAGWAPCKVNLILYNTVAGLPFRRPSEARLHRFIRRLVARGVTVTVRRSRGQDIDAACGQLAGQDERGMAQE